MQVSVPTLLDLICRRLRQFEMHNVKHDFRNKNLELKKKFCHCIRYTNNTILSLIGPTEVSTLICYIL